MAQLKAKREETRRKAKSSLMHFTLATMPEYKPTWFHRSYAATLDKFVSGEIKRLMVFIPPQHGKSELCTRRMPAQILGLHPNKKVAVAAYNHSFASKFNRDIQRIIDSPSYQSIFPDTKLWGENVRSNATGTYLRNSDEFEIVGYNGSLRSVGIGGGLTGLPVDTAIVDDPYKDRKWAISAAYNKQLQDWWTDVLMMRLNNDSQICLTFTRWTDDDIAGWLLKKEKENPDGPKWHVVTYQGIKEKDFGDPHDKRQIGESLWEERHSAAKHMETKATSPRTYNALIQQNPTDEGGNIIKDNYFFRFNRWELPQHYRVMMYIDTAQSEKELEGNDPTGYLVFAVIKNSLYLLRFEKGMHSIGEQLGTVQRLAKEFGFKRSSTVWIENKDNAKSLKSQLKINTNLNIRLENIKGKKLERVKAEEPILEARRVGLPNAEGWVEPYLEQLRGFPNLTHDEEVDVLTGAIRTGLGSHKGYSQAN